MLLAGYGGVSSLFVNASGLRNDGSLVYLSMTESRGLSSCIMKY